MTTNAVTTARFWDYLHDWTRLALRDGQTLAHVTGGLTDEGYYQEATVYTRDGNVITREIERESRDCDGRHSSRSVQTCALAELAGNPTDDAAIRVPAWQDISRRQRDYSAEAAGY